jgi:uncharacterized repeat protein (TIGR01451 family)
VDQKFDGSAQTVPDGVLYVVEGTGGNRDFDGNEANPRGQGSGVDQEDSATGMGSYGPGLNFPNGPAGWLDTNLTSAQMAAFFPNAGAGPKITAKFKAKIFGFGDVVVNDNTLTLYQISEPLLPTSSATAANPAPFGTDLNGKPLNDPIPDTLLDPASGAVVSPPADGTPALLDKFTVSKPDVSASLQASISAAATVVPGGSIQYTITLSNKSQYALNGTQVVAALPNGVEFDGELDARTTLQGRRNVVITVGRVVPGEQRTVQFQARVAETQAVGGSFSVGATVRSATAQPVVVAAASTRIVAFP